MGTNETVGAKTLAKWWWRTLILVFVLVAIAAIACLLVHWYCSSEWRQSVFNFMAVLGAFVGSTVGVFFAARQAEARRQEEREQMEQEGRELVVRFREELRELANGASSLDDAALSELDIAVKALVSVQEHSKAPLYVAGEIADRRKFEVLMKHAYRFRETVSEAEQKPADEAADNVNTRADAKRETRDRFAAVRSEAQKVVKALAPEG